MNDDSIPNFSDFTDPTPREDQLNMLRTMASTLREKINKVADAQATLDLLTADLNRFQLSTLPEAMEIAGVADYTLSDGTRLIVRDDVKASIAVDNRPYAHNWLREHGHGGVIKESFMIDLRTLSHEQREALKDAIIAAYDVMPESIEAIHPSTLKALVKELLEKGTSMPASFSVFQFKKAELKEIKKTK